MTHRVWISFSQRRSQITLTFLCLSVTFCLLGLLLSLRQAFEAGTNVASSFRLRTSAATSVAATLPLSYGQKIAQAPGVKFAIHADAVPAAYQDNSQHLLLQAVSVDHFFDTFPELLVDDRQRVSFEDDKLALMAGQAAVDRYGWKLGQTITLQTNMLRSDGSASWTFHLVAIYKSDDPKVPDDLTFVHYRYLNDSRLAGKDSVLGYIATIGDPSQAALISKTIDAEFETSSPRIRTQPENVAVQEQLAQFGDFNALILSVAGAVFFSMFLLSHNIWYERVGMRRTEFAILKVIGFRVRTIFAMVVFEALVLTVTSAAAGMLAAAALVAVVRPAVTVVLGGFYLPMSAVAQAAIIALGFGITSSFLPAAHAANTPLIEGLKGPS